MKAKYFSSVPVFLALLVVANTGKTQSLNPLTVGTIHPGDSVVIYYDVTINTGAGTQVSNQGAVTANGLSIVTDDPATAAANDPTIVQLNMFPLPVTLVELKATPKETGVEVAWNTASESNMLRYEVERSSNGRDFQKIGEAAAKNSSQMASYSVTDQTAGSVNFYRLKLLDRNGNSKYSQVVRVDLSGAGATVRIYPNPVANKQLTVQLSNVARGNYEVVVYDHAGQQVYRQTISLGAGSLNKTLTLPSALAKGFYQVQLRSGKILASQMILLQ